MDWTPERIEVLSRVVSARWRRMGMESRTDRRNLSEKWNRYLREHSAVVLRNESKLSDAKDPSNALRNLLDMVNYENGVVSDALAIRNPDRPGQYILLPRDVASRIVVLGMI